MRAPEEGGATTRIVVIDDHSSYAHGLRSLIETLTDDLRVVAVTADVEQAPSIVEETRPHVALVDVRMPQREGGLDLAAKLCAGFPETRVAMLSVSGEPRDVRDAMAAGASGFLSKEAEPEDLIVAIRAIRAGYVVLSEGLAYRFFQPMPDVSDELLDHELEILRLLARGDDIPTVAKETLVSESTLKRSIRRIQRKLNVESRIEAVAEAARRGLI